MRSNFRFCALVLAITLCGCVQNSTKGNDHNHPVALEVKAGVLSDYKHTFGSDGKPYSYRYSGGDDGSGNLQIYAREGHNVTIPVHLNADQEFSIVSLVFQRDQGQLSFARITNPKEAVIQDMNTVAFPDGYYAVIVVDDVASDNKVIISFDPGIINNR
jgi:hypothetical protein